MSYTPESLYNILKQTVIGQDDYIKSLATTMWLHDLRIKSSEEPYPKQKIEKHNMLIVGPTGSGKTLAIQTLARELGYRGYLVPRCYRSGMLFLDTTTLQLKPNLVNTVALRFTTWTSGGRLRDIRELLSSSVGGNFNAVDFLGCVNKLKILDIFL